jgi:hypothetical protein
MRKKDGTITRLETVDTMMPPITAVAIGARNDPPSPTPSAGGEHPRRHGDGGHHDGLGALVPGLDDGLEAGHALGPHLDGEVHEQDRVLGHDPHQHQDPDHDRHGDRVLRQDQRRGHAPDREGEREEDREGLDQRLEEQDQHREHEEEAQHHRVDEGAHELLLDLGIARFGDADARGQRHAVHDLLKRAVAVLSGTP